MIENSKIDDWDYCRLTYEATPNDTATQTVSDIHRILREDSEPLPADFQKVWDDNRETLYEP